MPITADDYAVHVSLRTTSGLPEDRIVNTWAVRALDGAAEYGDLEAAFDAFYDAIDGIFSTTVDASANAHTISIYHLQDPEPRAPVSVANFTAGGTGAALPSEVAICTSFAAAGESGVNPARRRGRVFLGPLSESVIDVDNGYAWVAEGTRSTIAGATEAMVEYLPTVDWQLCVWSRAESTLFPVVRGWVDDTFDTQRRRGPSTTSRTLWAV